MFKNKKPEMTMSEECKVSLKKECAALAAGSVAFTEMISR
jgi:hypothetical protein